MIFVGSQTKTYGYLHSSNVNSAKEPGKFHYHRITGVRANILVLISVHIDFYPEGPALKFIFEQTQQFKVRFSQKSLIFAWSVTNRAGSAFVHWNVFDQDNFPWEKKIGFLSPLQGIKREKEGECFGKVKISVKYFEQCIFFLF